MTKKERDNIATVISGIFLIASLSLYWLVFNSSNYIVFFGIIFATFIIRTILTAMLPTKKKKQQGKSQRNKTNTATKTTTMKPSPNRLRSDKDIMEDTLENLSWREFERLCFLYFKAKGYKPKETSEGADGGVDLIIYNPKDQAHEAVQIKHYIHSGNQITVKEIRELHTAKKNHKCMLSMFITTSTFTNPALREADTFNIHCHNINWVKNNIVRWKDTQGMKIS
ncbi:restriction endonuclease [Evansella sp. AB-P1]|uniref:restriction endonuclease n=1 Tax=Evansella sp. AB-P1 TaxID=3037653 RepID=UPI00241CD7F1|nr:restriction endonuclease [Evansella sp. AB-P1]MDG5790136.1 restriction endonuclease [Evansella sp. AB-P1]